MQKSLKQGSVNEVSHDNIISTCHRQALTPSFPSMLASIPAAINYRLLLDPGPVPKTYLATYTAKCIGNQQTTIQDSGPEGEFLLWNQSQIGSEHIIGRFNDLASVPSRKKIYCAWIKCRLNDISFFVEKCYYEGTSLLRATRHRLVLPKSQHNSL